jgi:hypothetical protein
MPLIPLRKFNFPGHWREMSLKRGLDVIELRLFSLLQCFVISQSGKKNKRSGEIHMYTCTHIDMHTHTHTHTHMCLLEIWLSKIFLPSYEQIKHISIYVSFLHGFTTWSVSVLSAFLAKTICQGLTQKSFSFFCFWKISKWEKIVLLALIHIITSYPTA